MYFRFFLTDECKTLLISTCKYGLYKLFNCYYYYYKVLSKQTRDSKLSPNYEPDPYIYIYITHMKKFVEPATIEIEASKGPEQHELPEASSGTSAVRPASRQYNHRKSSRTTPPGNSDTS